MRKVSVAAVRGNCNAGLETGNTFFLDGLHIVPHNHNKFCAVACASVIANASRYKLQEGTIYISCPDPATGAGGNVIFELSPKE